MVLMLSGIGLLIGGAAMATLGSGLPGSDGFVTSSTSEWRSPGYAVRADASVELVANEVNLPDLVLGTLRATADPETDNGVFIGVAPTSDVDGYLRHVARSTVEVPLAGEGDGPVTRFVDGGSPRVAPADANFWIASSYGAGAQTVTWDPQGTDLTLVVMNGEGTTPVAADVSVGGELADLEAWGLFALGAGLAVVALGAAIAGPLRRR